MTSVEPAIFAWNALVTVGGATVSRSPTRNSVLTPASTIRPMSGIGVSTADASSSVSVRYRFVLETIR